MQLGGYVVDFDIRDPGRYYLQLGISWFFGATDPKEQPQPICTGSHMTDHYRESNLIRSLVHGGEDIVVELTAADAKPTAETPQFGAQKCTSGDAAGRWLNIGEAAEHPCKPPYCSGNRTEIFHDDNVSSYRYWICS